ncbi:MAG: YybH family protein [Pseudomonadota bacterium]
MIGRLLALFALLVALPAAAQSAEPDPRAAVEAAMLRSADGWNHRDLDGFLGIYSDDPATSFTTARGLVRGKAAVRERYVRGYPELFGPDASGTPRALSFTFQDFRMLGPEHALLIARWHLAPGGGKDAASGMTSLVFRREVDGWKIVADHSD